MEPNRPNVDRLYMDPTGAATEGEVVDISSTDHTFTSPVRAIYVGVSGDVKVTTLGGTDIVFTGAPIGVLPIGAIAVIKVGTTATNMVGLY